MMDEEPMCHHVFIASCLGLALFAPPGYGQGKAVEPQEYMERILRPMRVGHPSERLEGLERLLIIARTLQGQTGFLCGIFQSDRDPKARQRAGEVLAAIRPRAGFVMHFALRGLKDRDDGVRIAAMDIIAAIAPSSREALPHLLQYVADKNPAVRRRAISALATFGDEASFAIPALVLALDDPHKAESPRVVSVSEAAWLALKSIGPDAHAVGMALSVILRADEKSIKAPGFMKQVKLNPESRKSIPLLVRVLNDKAYPKVQIAAAYALGLLGPAADAAVADLTAALKAKGQPKEAELRKAAVWALGEIGPAAKAAVPTLRQLESDAALRPIVAAALRRIQVGN